MREEQAMQRPSFASPSRRDEDHRAGRGAENRRCHPTQCTPREICSNLRAHDNHGGIVFSGSLDDSRCPPPRPAGARR
jgi:hypothetical protein